MEDRSDDDIIDLTIDHTPAEKYGIIVAFDPGPVNCGVCMYDVDNEKVLSMQRISFRDKIPRGENGLKTDTDLGNVKLIDSVRDYVMDNYDGWKSKGVRVFVEDQVAGRKDKGDGYSSLNGETTAIQYSLQALLGSDMCMCVGPRQVKTHFRDHFPQVEERENEPHNVLLRRQYAADKQNAVKNGRQFVSAPMLQEIWKDKKRDDYFDAMWICRYMSDVMRGRPSYSAKRKAAEKEERRLVREAKKEETQRKNQEKKKAAVEQRESRKKKRKVVYD